MSEQLAQNDPKVGFIVVKNERLSDLASESIDLLYQPIIGSAATALVRLLWRYSDERRIDHEQRSHYDLFAFLQIDFRRFKELRIKLEGAGLLRTLVQRTDSQPVMIYQLVPPLSNRQFFNDDLLSLALLENVGEKMYQQLAHRLLIKPFEMTNTEEITQDFLDSFQIDADQITDQPNSIGQLKHEYHLQQQSLPSKATTSEPIVDGREFNFQLVLDCLAKSYVNIDQVKKAYQLIMNEHRLYGIDEVSLANLIIRATNVRNNVFDPQKLKILVNRMYQPAPKLNPQPSQQVQQPESAADKEFSAEERSLIKGANYYPPITFLNKLKHRNHGFPVNSENQLIQEMLERNIMSTGALNMLVYHVLVDQGKPQIPKSLFNYVANDWVQNYHVQSASDAMRAIKAYNQKNEQAPARSGGGYRSQKPIQQFEPDWMKKDYQENSDEISEEERRKTEEMIKNFNKKK
ncbi:hypothetical protein [Lactobacillus sp. Sy-1]|uniref:hypothetical protein n=1 Tax=Lactobacillus sp. Sy-1 TaxID=2109645 RepID=UPI001C579D06|nr:hypothetical protein [Lactobacillus sp. Sy-1]MBW1605700.1 hypothetical protein [Lactobacillus sp. Sy-1]